jgi:TIR domain
LEWVMANSTVFISYAREDAELAIRLYNDLKRAGIQVWLDKVSLLPGQRWEVSIRETIKTSRYFIPLISVNSVKKVGYVQREVRMALDILDEYPESEIYMIPVRLDKSEPDHPKLRELHWVDMFPDWHDGLNKILLSVKVDSQLPALESFRAKTKSTPLSPMEFAVSEGKRSELFQRIQAFAPPDLVPEALYKADKSNQDEVNDILSDSSLTTEDKVTLMIMTIMKKLDQDIERQAQYIDFVQQ